MININKVLAILIISFSCFQLMHFSPDGEITNRLIYKIIIGSLIFIGAIAQLAKMVKIKELKQSKGIREFALNLFLLASNISYIALFIYCITIYILKLL